MSEEYAEESAGHIPPWDLQAEQSALRVMLMSKDAISGVVEAPCSNDFYQPKHENIFEPIISLHDRGESADPITIAAELGRTGDPQCVSETVYPRGPPVTISIVADASYYAETVHEKTILRRLANVSTQITQLGYQGQDEVDKIVDETQQTLSEVMGPGASEDHQLLNDLMEPAFGEMETIANSDGALSGMPTGFNELGSLTSGFHPGRMIIVVARPGMGESTFALDVCRTTAIHHDLATVSFSLKMNRTEIVMKVPNAEALVPLQKVHDGCMNENDWQHIIDRPVTLSGKPLFIDDSPNLTMMEVRVKARRPKQRNSLQLICIDYIQPITPDRKVGFRQLEVLGLLHQTKLLAKESEVSVVALLQFSRDTEQCKDGMP